MSIYGNPVMMGGSGGGGDFPWNDNIAINWDFTNPVNTRGQSSYTSSGAIIGINGWQQYNSTTNLTADGITTLPGANIYQFINSTDVPLLLGKTITMSVLSEDYLESETFVVSSNNGYQFTSGDRHTMANGVQFWSYRDSSTQLSISWGYSGSGTSKPVKAIKYELGSTQTLAHKVGNVWVLNQQMSQDSETLKGRAMISSSW